MSLKAFMKQNTLKRDNKFVVISKRMVEEKIDEKTKEKTLEPVLWELKPIPEKLNARLKEEATEHDYSKEARRKGQTTTFNSTFYIQKLLAASVVYPDLKDIELQASYGVVGEEKLLVEMLYSDEYALLQEAVDDFDGQITETIEDHKDEVKNS